ncbi:hypothetical protein GOQ30_11485 [Flavobacterium sp. TP390]|uniref:Uncharacterized protein n=1 Tax=Flavobacterium profundi TaxID=1774945 RepID=A0A6I4IM61_9FLAO|nr:hypothetical protein [Flavobacterium profundi]MVO09781.1 hypothetical protein [Flavobacterium profundi]
MIKRLIASFLVLVSGMILLSDLFVSYYNIEFKNIYGFNSTTNFVFWLSMMISQFLIIIAAQFKPYRISYLAPIYIISLSLYWIFFSNDYDNKSYFNIYVLGFSLALLVVISLISMIMNKEKVETEQKNAKLKLLENIFDLTVLKIKKADKN